GGGDQILPARQLPPGRGERDPGGDADGGEVRRARLPARGRRGPLRGRAAPLAPRLHLRGRFAREPDPGVRRYPPRAFLRSGRDPQGALHAPDGARLLDPDEARVARRARVSEREGLGEIVVAATPAELRNAVRALAQPARAAVLQKFFKTGPGEYGE